MWEWDPQPCPLFLPQNIVPELDSFNPVCKKLIYTQRRDACLFHFCTEMGARWFIHKASTTQLAHGKAFTRCEQQLSNSYHYFPTVMLNLI